MLVRDEFWNIIEGSRVHLLYDREGMDGAGWDAQVAVCAATLINDRQQGLQGKGVYRAKGYARRTPETAVRIDEKGVPWPLSHEWANRYALSKLPQPHDFRWNRDLYRQNGPFLLF